MVHTDMDHVTIACKHWQYIEHSQHHIIWAMALRKGDFLMKSDSPLHKERREPCNYFPTEVSRRSESELVAWNFSSGHNWKQSGQCNDICTNVGDVLLNFGSHLGQTCLNPSLKLL